MSGLIPRRLLVPSVVCAAVWLLIGLSRSSSLRAQARVLPKVPPGFQVALFAREPLIRNPAAMCFDARGRLCVGQGPQFRSPKPETPGDSVRILIDTDGDGVADRTETFATGFNCIQGLAWKGKDLWVANAPDLTVVRDLNGDDRADEYVLIYTDLGNLEHGLHGLNWGPDGKLYMSKGNSKGHTKRADHVAPAPFRELWHVPSPDGAPDRLPVRSFRPAEYRKSYHDPSDDWGLTGGVLRCDDMGERLEIVARGFRNPWDISFDEGFNWIGTDNDQDGGDKTFMPFYGAHFGWGHPWSYSWTGYDHPPTVPPSAPFQIGSATGVVFYGGGQLPAEFRRVFFLNDWDRQTIWVFRPSWDGALMTARDGRLEPFARADGALFKPSDIVVGPDGALYCGGWGREYGVQWKKENREQLNEGRIFCFSHEDFPLLPRARWFTDKRRKPRSDWTVEELIDDLAGDKLPVWKVDAQNELVRRGERVRGVLVEALSSGRLRLGQETWVAWALGRMAVDTTLEAFFARNASRSGGGSLNLRIQCIRILAHRVRNYSPSRRLPDVVVSLLSDPEARIRFEAVQAIWQARQRHCVEPLVHLAAIETDRLTYYSAWGALRDLASDEARRELLDDPRPRVRFAALMASLGGLRGEHATRDLSSDELMAIIDKDPSTEVREWALRFLVQGPKAHVTRKRDEFRPGMKDLREVIRRFRQVGNQRLRAAFLGIIAASKPERGEWEEVRAIYRELKGKTDGRLTAERVATLLPALARDDRALPLLWEELSSADETFRRAALDGFVLAGGAAREYLSDRIPRAREPGRQARAIEALSRMATALAPWRPSREMIGTLASVYGRENDPRLRSRILVLLAQLDRDLLRRATNTAKLVERVTRGAAKDPDPRVNGFVPSLAEKLGISIEVTGKRKSPTVDEVLALVQGADMDRGRELFFDTRRANCSGCHRAAGRGAEFAPPLGDIGLRAKPREIVESILTPSRKIVEGYRATTFITKQGRVLTAVVRKETAVALELLPTDGGPIELEKDDIALRRVTDESIMPANFGEMLAKEELADLVRWLQELKSGPTKGS